MENSSWWKHHPNCQTFLVLEVAMHTTLWERNQQSYTALNPASNNNKCVEVAILLEGLSTTFCFSESELMPDTFNWG